MTKIDTNKNLLTKEGRKKLEDELKKMLEVERPKAIEEIKIARDQGDLSENAEYDAAREKQGQIEDRIIEIERILDNSKTITNQKTLKDIVLIGSTVELMDLSTSKKEVEKYKIVGTLETDPFSKPILISNESPLARSILDKKVGETVIVDVAKSYEVKIVSVKQ